MRVILGNPASLLRATLAVCAGFLLLQFSLPPSSQSGPAAPYTVESVLKQLDLTSPKIQTFSANVEVTDYVKVADETTTHRGTMNFEKGGDSPLYALDLTEVRPPGPANGPAPRLGHQLDILKNNWIWHAESNTKELFKTDMSQHRDLVENYFRIGLGETGEQLAKSYAVSAPIAETLDSLSTVRLTLTPRDPAVLRSVNHVELWLDTTRWLALQLKIWRVGGDFTQLHYSSVNVNPKIDASRFDTKFSGYTVMSH